MPYRRSQLPASTSHTDGEERRRNKNHRFATSLLAVVSLYLFMPYLIDDQGDDFQNVVGRILRSIDDGVSKPKKRAAKDENPEVLSRDLEYKSEPCRNTGYRRTTLQFDSFCARRRRNEKLDSSNDSAELAVSGASPKTLGLALEVMSQFDRIIADVTTTLKEDRSPERSTILMPNAVCLQQPEEEEDNEITSSNDADTENDPSLEITLTTHFAVSGKLTRFLAQVQRWDGPVSAAIYFYIHPRSNVPPTHIFEEFQMFVLENLEELQRVNFHFYVEFGDRKHPYPNNILRNIALDYAETKYFFLSDVDFFTSPIRTHDLITSMLATNPEVREKLDNKALLVLPAFDYKTKLFTEQEVTFDHKAFPHDKHRAHILRNIKQLEMKDEAYKVYHQATNVNKWLGNNTDVSYPIKYNFKFEPYIIGSKEDIPRFYEMFRGFGMNKYSWYVELHYAGYKFEVLRDFFCFHVKHTSSYGDARSNHLSMNQQCGKDFYNGLTDNYGVGSYPVWKGWETDFLG